MLFNVIICVLTAYVIVSPLLYAKALKIGQAEGKELVKEYKNLLKDCENSIRFGIEIGHAPEKQPALPIFNIPEDRPKPKMTPSEERTVQIMANIDRYDGTSNGQEKVKVNV